MFSQAHFEVYLVGILGLVNFLVMIHCMSIGHRYLVDHPDPPVLAGYPSPDEDGTFYQVNLSDPGDSLSRHDLTNGTVQFFLYTIHEGRETTNEIRIGEENPGWVKFFKKDSILRILCHGYKSSPDKPFPSELKTGLLGNSVNVNVVLVGWEALAGSDYVQTAVSNVRFVGEKTAEMLSYMYGLVVMDLKKVHFIGHNLGAHIGGVAGESFEQRTSRKLGRITGLDPAAVKDCDDKLNLLDASDALVVDAIHTDYGDYCGASWKSDGKVRRWGSGIQVGHVDYYPSSTGSNAITELCGDYCRSYRLLTSLMLNNPKTFDLRPLCRCESGRYSECRCRRYL